MTFDHEAFAGWWVYTGCAMIIAAVIALLVNNHLANAAKPSVAGGPSIAVGAGFPSGSAAIVGAGNPSAAPGLSDGADTTIIIGN